MNQIGTQYAIQVQEFQIPRDLDFIMLNYGERTLPVTHEIFNRPIFYDRTIKDIDITFDPNKIDEVKLYGKQYINIEVKIFNSKNDLLEIQNISNTVICPGNNSSRSIYYDSRDCRLQTINLNDYLMHKTFNLEHYSQIIITISHADARYNATGYSRKIKLVVSRKLKFDLDLSFPAGLIFYKFNKQTADASSALRNLWGISIAFIAQLSFYEEGKINKTKPYTFGAGFIAINAFDFSPSANRDLGAVGLATLVPLQAKKLSFPLYLGGGYLLVEQKWFVVFGPGIRLNF